MVKCQQEMLTVTVNHPSMGLCVFKNKNKAKVYLNNCDISDKSDRMTSNLVKWRQRLKKKETKKEDTH